jgi:protein-tyrosine phosphatase
MTSSKGPRADRSAPLRVIDLHCHILPGIDDGALDLEDSVAMARIGAADGIEVIAATPHIRHDHDVRIAELARRVEEVNAELRRAEVPVTIVSGGEVAETALDGLDEEELRAVSLAGAGWILLEPRPGPLGDSLLESIDGLHETGFRALIAHPERHLSDDISVRIARLVDRGALVQGTAAYLAQEGTRDGMLALAGRGLIHVLASDAHSSHGGRPLRVSEGITALGQIEALRPHLDWIAREAPAAILRGDAPEPPFPASP